VNEFIFLVNVPNTELFLVSTCKSFSFHIANIIDVDSRLFIIGRRYLKQKKKVQWKVTYIFYERLNLRCVQHSIFIRKITNFHILCLIFCCNLKSNNPTYFKFRHLGMVLVIIKWKYVILVCGVVAPAGLRSLHNFSTPSVWHLVAYPFISYKNLYTS